MDQPHDYRPARSTDFERAATRIDPNDVTTPSSTAPPVAYGGSTNARTAHLRETHDHGVVGARAPPEVVEERTTTAPVDRRPFSLAAGFFGWAVASFFTLVFVTLALALLGVAAFDATNAGTTGITAETFNSLTMAGLVALLVAQFLAYLLGGYVAGRIGLWHGLAHGLAVVGWAILFTLLVIGLGATFGDAVVNLNLIPAIDWGALTGPAIGGLLALLAVMLAGAVLGAKLGTRPYGIDGAAPRHGRAWRGRPL